MTKDTVSKSDGTPAAFVELEKAECLALLAGADLGRLAVIVEDYPLVFPVNYVLDGEVVIFRTAPGTKYEASLHSKVSFEVDYMAPDRSTGWSVLVLGAIDRNGLTEEERARVVELDVHPLAPGDKPVWARVVADRITGRRVDNSKTSPIDLH